MAIRTKGDMWALNALVAVGLIAVFLFGFFMVASVVLPGDIAEIKASVVGSSYGSQLLNIFRVPVRGMNIADIVSGSSVSGVSCPDVSDALRFVYGPDMSYSLTVDQAVLCSGGSLKKSVLKSEFVLPSYDGSVHNVSVEVSK